MKLTPEQIGRAGEIKLDEICNEISLTCVSLVPDLLGVDRHVEFSQPELSSFDSLDKRPALLSCYVQVKSKEEQQRYWQLSLSVAERLAKSGKPAFVALFEIGERAKVTRGYLAHLRGDLLARVLQRLRDAQRRGITDLNKRMLNLSRKDGVEFELNGESFASSLQAAIGKSMSIYAAEKQTEVETLGFGRDRITAEIKFKQIDLEALVDAHLGERSLAVDEFNVAERRFNISLPFARGPLASGILTIEARPVDGFELRIEHKETGETVSLPCALVYPNLPGLPSQALKFHVLSDLITLKVSHGKFTYNAKLNDDQPRSLASWQRQLSAMLMLPSGRCKVWLKRVADNIETYLGTSEGPVDLDMRDYEGARRLVDAARFLLAKAKVSEEPIRLDALLSNPGELTRAHAIMSRAEGVSPLSFTCAEPLPGDDKNSRVLFISAYVIGEDWFAYAARTTVERVENSDEWIGRELIPVMAERIQEPVLDSYREFQARARDITGLSTTFIHRLDPVPEDGHVRESSLTNDEAVLENK